MAKEIERKFLVDPDNWSKDGEAFAVTQGYISVDPERTVRVRIIGKDAYLTIKGRTTGITRDEFEYPIPLPDAVEMLKMAIYPPIEKIRYQSFYSGKLWEVDEFLGANKGLIVAEIELENENELLIKPEWVMQEVSDDRRYFNSSMAQHPFQKWE